MIKKYHGIQWSEPTPEEISKMSQDFLNSDISLGMHKEKSKTEKNFLDMFKPVSTNIVVFSAVSEKDIGLGGGGGDECKLLIENLYLQIGIGLTINLAYDLLKVSGKKIFSLLKEFLLDAHAESPQTLAIKIKVKGGAEVTYKLPKYLKPNQIQTAIEEIEKESNGEKYIERRLWTNVTFDTLSEKFEEE